jgi:hypothetical protein
VLTTTPTDALSIVLYASFFAPNKNNTISAIQSRNVNHKGKERLLGYLYNCNICMNITLPDNKLDNYEIKCWKITNFFATQCAMVSLPKNIYIDGIEYLQTKVTL